VTGRLLSVPDRYDLARSLRVLAVGQDPTVRVGASQLWWATRTPDGPGTLHLRLDRTDGELTAAGYGPGTGWLVERAGAVAGLHDDLTGFAELAVAHPVVARVAHVYAGVRLPATRRAFHHLVPTIISQKVSGTEASRSYARLMRHFGEPAPGPTPPGLLLPPDPAALAGTPYWSMHRFGLEQRRAETIVRGALAAAAVDRCPDPASATARLTAIPGIGQWTAAEVVRVAYGDPDAVSLGDLHLPNLVSWALAGEPRGTDERMLELLAPFPGHRARVVHLLGLAGLGAPRFGPRRPLRSFARF
jgi:3-methyladenine DNA glycosylase/8-oxoguanine DNA glycosylase